MSSSTGKAITDSLIMFPNMLKRPRTNVDETNGTAAMTLSERRRAIVEVYPNFVQPAAKRIHAMEQQILKEEKIRKQQMARSNNEEKVIAKSGSGQDKEEQKMPQKGKNNTTVPKEMEPQNKEDKSITSSKDESSSSSSKTQLQLQEKKTRNSEESLPNYDYTAGKRKRDFVQHLQREQEKLRKDMENIEQKRNDIFTRQRELWGVYKNGLETISKLTDLQDAPDAILPGNF
eukprot:CAMPEP_0195282050 /NCGR_PEP_ID=MMETSP0707-20130614/1103_1 /TAXON_ID=33640 /ORGANISM="Asterionellopsis glacialis, Strain CCMP134" /LENGTH=231 /DNA_ID=CAMNT_0040340999 /DNA_START=42 /DNA_END=740 /DNA_ORIENTATION=-